MCARADAARRADRHARENAPRVGRSAPYLDMVRSTERGIRQPTAPNTMAHRPRMVQLLECVANRSEFHDAARTLFGLQLRPDTACQRNAAGGRSPARIRRR